VQPCQSCGRFLCALCDCEFKGQHFCPACLEAGRSKGKIRNLQNQRTLYDSIALALVIVPIVTFLGLIVTPITAPIAIFLVLRHWNAPLGIRRRTKTRYVIALVLAVLEIIGWIWWLISTMR
jgi:hypothetical protein